ncbi:SDR family oxidoreductase [Granulicella sp. dw_53]
MCEQCSARRIGDPDEIAKAVSFLGSDDGRYVSGIELSIDGSVAQNLVIG